MRAIFFLLLISLAFAQPPIENIMDINHDRAPDLEDAYDPFFAVNSTFNMTFGNTTEMELPISASVQVAGLTLLMDNMTYPQDGLSLILARGHDQGHLISMHEDGYDDFICDFEWFYGGAQYANRCDFDNDNCAEFENESFVVYDTNATFIFHGVNETVRTSTNLIEVPQAILDEMEYSSGTDLLNVSIVSAALFNYVFNDRGYAFSDCTSNYVNVTGNLTIRTNASFKVAGKQKLFFLRSPVLNEQWHRNNRFNLVIMSQSPLYTASSYLNGEQSADFTLRTFNTTNNSFNLTVIVSNATMPDGWSESTNLTTPTPLEYESNSFAYIYEFNSTYSGLGKNVLGLTVTDAFLGEAEHEEVILSRLLSYNGTTNELGGPIDNVTRKSAGFQKGQISTFEISLGFLAVIILLVFLNFWIRK